MMFRNIYLFIIIFVLILLQITILPYFFVDFTTPNLLLIFILLLFSGSQDENIFKFNIEDEKIWLFPLFFGLFLDLYSFLPFGFFTLTFVISSGLVFYFTHNIIESGFNIKNYFLILFLSGLLVPLLILLVQKENISFLFLIKSIFVSAIFIIPLRALKNV